MDRYESARRAPIGRMASASGFDGEQLGPLPCVVASWDSLSDTFDGMRHVFEVCDRGQLWWLQKDGGERVGVGHFATVADGRRR